MDVSLADKAKKAPKRKRVVEDTGETAKRRSARVRNTKCKKEEKIDFQELLYKYLPCRCGRTSTTADKRPGLCRWGLWSPGLLFQAEEV